MVKVLVNGGLFEISKVEEIVEKRVPFNGTNIRLVQIAKDSKQAAAKSSDVSQHRMPRT